MCLKGLKNFLALLPLASSKFSDSALISEQSLPRIPARESGMDLFKWIAVPDFLKSPKLTNI